MKAPAQELAECADLQGAGIDRGCPV